MSAWTPHLSEGDVIPNVLFKMRVRVGKVGQNPFDWRKTKFEIVQSIREFKTDLNDYNFAMDKDIDAFADIRVLTHNGHGAAVTFNKSISLDNIYLLTDAGFNTLNNEGAFDSGYKGDAFF